jgi:hypothetical protein
VTLTEFLLARIAEDRARADTAFLGLHARRQDTTAPYRAQSNADAAFRIVEAAVGGSPSDQWMSGLTLEWVMKVIAEPYADHPDYRDEWKP